MGLELASATGVRARSARIEALRAAALDASRNDVMGPQVAATVLRAAWHDAPADEPVPIRCAIAEAETLRHAPLGLADGELLAGRLDPDAPPPSGDPLPPRAFPGGQTSHMALDADRLLAEGISGIEAGVRRRMDASTEPEKLVFYRSCLIALQGFRDLAARLREMARQRAEAAADPQVRAEMLELAAMLDRVPEHPAATFHEAIQAMHLLFFAATLTVCGLFGPGRPDRLLWPYYQRDLAEGRITRERALELICCQFILMNYVIPLPLPVMVGGIDVHGHDRSNELTELCLEADALVELLNPSLGLGVNRETPTHLLDMAAESLLAGRTKPSLFNDHTIGEGLHLRDATAEDSTNYIHSTCVEITICGASNILVASPYINLVKPLEWILNGGKHYDGSDAVGGEGYVNAFTRLQPAPIEALTTYDALLAEYERLLAGKIADAAKEQQDVRRQRAAGWAYPLLSCFTRDCIERGLDTDRGGARYTWTETSNVGLANLVDSLNVIRRRVYEERSWTLADVRDALASNFADDARRLALIGGVPRYGNGDEEADQLAARMVGIIYREHAKYRDGLGSHFVPGFFCWIMHRILGSETGASPDGRRAGEVLADAAGAAQGRDRSGPTAAARSITSWDHRPGVGGIVLNLRFAPGFFADAESRAKLVALIRAYVELGGFETQINSVDTATLRAAQERPEEYADLIVRVAGYSDYFTRLDPVMQEEVISRTEHGL